jgi:hypothetical protein
MKYAVLMGSSAVMYVTDFVKIDSGNQKFIGGTHRHADTQAYRQYEDHISLLSFFLKVREVG